MKIWRQQKWLWYSVANAVFSCQFLLNTSCLSVFFKLAVQSYLSAVSVNTKFYFCSRYPHKYNISALPISHEELYFFGPNQRQQGIPSLSWTLTIFATITCPYLVLNSDYHKIKPHEEVWHSKICQQTSLNRMVITPDQTPGNHRQVTKHSKDTKQPDDLPGTWVLDHAIAAWKWVSGRLGVITVYEFEHPCGVTAQGEAV